MFIELLSESCEEGEEFLYCLTEMSQYRISRPDQAEFLVIFYKLFQLRQAHRIRNATFLLAIFGKCTPGNCCYDY